MLRAAAPDPVIRIIAIRQCVSGVLVRNGTPPGPRLGLLSWDRVSLERCSLQGGGMKIYATLTRLLRRSKPSPGATSLLECAPDHLVPALGTLIKQITSKQTRFVSCCMIARGVIQYTLQRRRKSWLNAILNLLSPERQQSRQQSTYESRRT